MVCVSVIVMIPGEVMSCGFSLSSLVKKTELSVMELNCFFVFCIKCFVLEVPTFG